MNDDVKAVFARFAELDAQIKTLETEKEALRPTIQAEMEAQRIDQVKADYGTFFFTTRKTWKYSPKVEEMSTALKEQKKREEQDGTATAEEITSLSFKAAKSAETAA